MTLFLYAMKNLLLLVLIPICVYSQKRVEQTYDIQQIDAIHIDSDLIFKITINARPTDQIQLYTIVDGETYASALVHSKVIDNHLEITTGRTPDFTPYNDKLSAHKVLSIELEISIPEDLNIDIHSTLAEVVLSGHYGTLLINLGRGGLIGRDIRFRESIINTISGNVTLSLDKANVSASSRNGLKNIDDIFKVGPQCTIESIHGDIEVLQVM